MPFTAPSPLRSPGTAVGAPSVPSDATRAAKMSLDAAVDCHAITTELSEAVEEPKRYFVPAFDATVVVHATVPSAFMRDAYAVASVALAEVAYEQPTPLPKFSALPTCWS